MSTAPCVSASCSMVSSRNAVMSSMAASAVPSGESAQATMALLALLTSLRCPTMASNAMDSSADSAASLHSLSERPNWLNSAGLTTNSSRGTCARACVLRREGVSSFRVASSTCALLTSMTVGSFSFSISATCSTLPITTPPGDSTNSIPSGVFGKGG